MEFNKIIILFLIIILSGCVSSQKIRENVIYKTYIYAGYYIKSILYDDNYINVLTSEGIFRLRDNPEIPDSVWCYIRVEPTRHLVHPEIAERMDAKFLTWNGSDKEYRVYNINTSRIKY